MRYYYSDLRKEAVNAVLKNTTGSGLNTYLSKGIDEFVEALIKHIDNGDEVRIKGLGTFYRTKVNRNKKFVSPLNNKTYDVSKIYRIGFRASKTFK